jgi:hypothetical protein
MAIADDITLLQQLATYLQAISAAAGNLNADAAALSAALPVEPTGTPSPYTQFIVDIQNASKAILSGDVNPSSVASSLTTAVIPDLQAALATQTQLAQCQAQVLSLTKGSQANLQQLAAAQTLITQQQTQIAGYAQRFAALPASDTTPAPPPPPNVMTTGTFLVGIAAILGIGAGAYYVTKQAKTKAKEAHAAGVFKPRRAAAREGEEEEEEEDVTPAARQMTAGRGR